MFEPVEVKALPEYRLWVRYADGVEGEIDLTDLAGRGVFKYWDDYGNFEDVAVGDGGAIIWSDRVDLCPDAMYLKITGKRPEEVFPSLGPAAVNA